MNEKYTTLLVFVSGILLAYILFSKNSTNVSTLNGQNQNSINSNLQHNIMNYNKYKNNEKWHIIRDKDGNLIDIEVIRDAKLI